MKKTLLFIFGALLLSFLVAAPVSQANILLTAENWLEQNSSIDYIVNNFEIVSDSLGIPCFYKINFSPSGFVVITADDRCYPILGYSQTGSISSDNPELQELLGQYKNAISSIIGANLSNTQTQQIWSDILINTTNVRNTHTLPSFEPEWTQGDPYNRYCPYFTYGVGFFQPGRSVVGCVATAFAQIVNYYNVWDYQFIYNIDNYHSEKVIDHHTYEVDIDSDANRNGSDFPTFQELNDSLESVKTKFVNHTNLSDNDKAALSFASGVLLKVNYSPYSTGADLLYDGQRAYEKLHYSCSTALYASHTYDDWKQLIIDELSENRPVQYGISGSPGHSFVIYGFDNGADDDYFKINWGWGGNNATENSFWKLNNLTSVSSSYSLSNHKMIFKIKPLAHIIQNVQLSDNSIQGNIEMRLTNTNTNEILGPFYQNNQGIFDLDIEPGTYNITISHNSGYFLPYNQNNVTLISGFNSLQANDIVLYNGLITGQVALSDQPQYSNNVAIELLNNSGTIINATQSSSFQFPVGNGEYSVRYKIPGMLNNKSYYSYTTGTIVINQGCQTINIPPVTLHPIAISQIYVKSGAMGDGFTTLAAAITYLKTIVLSPNNTCSQTYIYMYDGEYEWPYLTNDCGVDFQYNNSQITTFNLSIRKVGSGNVILKPPLLLNKVLVNVTNVKLYFEGIHFDQSTLDNRHYEYDIQSSGNSSFNFYNCIMGSTINTPQYRIMTFSNTSNIVISECNFLSCRGVYYEANQDIWMNNGMLRFNNCSNVNINNCTFKNNSALDGGAINADYVSAFSITSSIFESNSASGYGGSMPGGTKGSAVYINHSSNLEILNNQFLHNVTSGGSGPIHIGNSTCFKIAYNRFEDNGLHQVGMLMLDAADAIGFAECNFDESMVISNNIVISNIYSYYTHFIVVGDDCQGYLNIYNCDFIRGSDSSDYKKIIYSLSPINVTFGNCIFETSGLNAECLIPEPSTTTVKYSFFSDNYSGFDIATNIIPNTLDIGLDENFIPIWNAEFKSPCIDNGNPDMDGNEYVWYEEYPDIDKDPDGSQMDIGAKHYEDYNHKNNVINLKKSEVWNWFCIPAIDYLGSMRGADHETYVFDEYHDNRLFDNTNNRILEKIMWMYNDDINNIHWEADVPIPCFQHPEPMHHVRAQYGYKVQLLQEDYVPEIKPIEYTGFLPGGSGNEVPTLVIDAPVEDGIGCEQNGATGVWERETWIGYFLEKSLHPFDALIPVLDNIVSIKAQEWSMDRVVENGIYQNEWNGAFSEDVAINYGEMVSVRYIGQEQAVFQWGNNDPVPPYVACYIRPQPEHFICAKREDYLPIYATLDLSNYPPGTDNMEIAIFIDGECVGAEKISGEDMQIKAYLDTDDFTQWHDKVIEFTIWSPSKNECNVVKNFAIKNQQTNRYEVRNSLPEKIGNYLKVSLKPKDIEDAQLPALTSLGNNYPNPFNPETTIRFDLAKSGKAKLEIFNVKGQIVKTLVNGDIDAGYHSIKWNGKDDQGKSVSSGVYFSRLISDGKSLTNKMLMLK